MIKEIGRAECAVFFDLLGEVEQGTQFDRSNPQHVAWLNHRIDEYFFRGAKFFAAYTDDQTPLGLAVVLSDEQLFGVDRKAELLAIGIFKEFRGQGHGTALLSYVEDQARASGIYCLFMSTYAAAHQVISFYGRNGYPPVGSLPDVHGPRAEGIVLMRKILQ